MLRKHRQTRKLDVNFEINLNNKEWDADHYNKSKGVGFACYSYSVGGHKKSCISRE